MSSKISKVDRISIMGGPGTGKSTLAKNLGKELNLPVYHIDGINYFENWEKRDEKERDKIILEKVAEPKWVMDGTYKSTLEARVERSDLVIFLDYSAIARLKGIFSRYFKTGGKDRTEIPGCKEKMEWKFVKFAINWKKQKENIVKEALEKNKDKNILIFKSRKELNKWYQQEFKKKIEV